MEKLKKVGNMSKNMILLINLFFLLNSINIFVAGDTICGSEECQNFSNSLIDAMNMSMNPCNDFYNFVCGKWPEKDPLLNRKYTRTYKEWEETVIKRLINILKDKSSPVDPESSKKTKRIYQMCIGDLNDAGLDYLKKFLSELGGWPITIYPRNTWNPDGTIKWQDIHTNFSLYNLTGALYTTETRGYSKPHNFQYITVLQPQINDTRQDRKLIKKVVQLLIATDNPLADSAGFKNSINRDVSNIVNFMNSLRQITVIEAPNYVHQSTITKLGRLYRGDSVPKKKSKINWLNVFQSVYSGHAINKSEIIRIKNREYFKKLHNLLKNTPLRTIVNYVFWNFINQLLSHVSADTRDLIGFPNESYDIERRCLNEPNLKHAIYYEYIKKYISKDTLISANDIIYRVRDMLKKQIKELSWLNKGFVGSINNYLSNVTVMLGGPSWYNDSAIDLYYKDVHIFPTYLQSVLSVLRFEKMKDAEQLDMQMRLLQEEEYKWNRMSPLKVNAVYSHDLAAIRVPAGILSFMYNMERPVAANYAALGYVVAHELVHAYDRFFTQDDYGDMDMRNSVQIYKNKTKCLIDKYSNLNIPGLKNFLNTTNGTLTLAENIADTGILTAYKAFQVSNNGQRLIHLENFTSEQLFFISFGRTTCESLRPDAEVHPNIANNFKHAPWPVRVYGSLSNMKQFSDAFNCTLGSPMNPVEKCGLWDNNWLNWNTVVSRARRNQELFQNLSGKK